MADDTKIDIGYLTGLRNEVQEMLDELTKTTTAHASSDPATTGWIKPVDGTLQVSAGGFQAATDLNTALKTMGGTVAQQMQWLNKVFTDMISECTQTIQKFKDAETMNGESASQLMQYFNATINDLLAPPGSTGSGGQQPGSGQPGG
jgi:hypothetical protein